MATVNKDFQVRNGVTAGTLVKGQTLESTIATGTARSPRPGSTPTPVSQD